MLYRRPNFGGIEILVDPLGAVGPVLSMYNVNKRCAILVVSILWLVWKVRGRHRTALMVIVIIDPFFLIFLEHLLNVAGNFVESAALAGCRLLSASRSCCVVGPTLLFERYVSSQSLPRRYYACSACRSRKECQFFQWADRRKSQKRSSVKRRKQEIMHHRLHKAHFSRRENSCLLHVCNFCPSLTSMHVTEF